MKKLLTVVFAVLLTAGLSFAQDTGGDKAQKGSKGTTTTADNKKVSKTSKAHKGGKKSKKGSTTLRPVPPPK